MSKKLGTLVKEARTEKGLTQAALAKKVKDLTASDISKIERGEKEPEQTQIRELAAALGVTQTVLKGGSVKDIFRKEENRKQDQESGKNRIRRIRPEADCCRKETGAGVQKSRRRYKKSSVVSS